MTSVSSCQAWSLLAFALRHPLVSAAAEVTASVGGRERPGRGIGGACVGLPGEDGLNATR